MDPTSRAPEAQPDQIAPLKWVYISGVAFVVSLAVGIGFIVFAGQLTFIPNSIYYIILIPIALSAAAFLFGAMRSHAKYVGKSSYGTVELTGPVVVFGLVILGGLFLANRPSTFSLTVRVHGPGGRADIIREGSLTLDLGDDRRTRVIGSDGQAVFAQVPANFQSDGVVLLPDVRGYRTASEEPVPVPSNNVIELALEQLDMATQINGTVFDAAQRTVSGATLSFGAGTVIATSDSLGNFSATVPHGEGTTIGLTVTLGGRVVYDSDVVVAETPPLRLAISSPGQ